MGGGREVYFLEHGFREASVNYYNRCFLPWMTGAGGSESIRFWIWLLLSLSSAPGWNGHFKSPSSLGEGGPLLIFFFFFPLCTFQRKCLQPGYFCFPSSETFKVPRRTSSYGNRFDSHLARVEPTFYWTARWSPVKWRDKHEEAASSSSCEEMGLESWNWARLFHLGQVLRNPAFARSQRPEDNKSSAKNG